MTDHRATAALTVTHGGDRPVALEVALKQDGTEAWFTVTCPCGCDQGAVIVSMVRMLSLARRVARGLLAAMLRAMSMTQGISSSGARQASMTPRR